MIEIVDKDNKYIIDKLDKQLGNILSENQYDNFVNIGILFPENLRITGSSKNELKDINNEIMISLENPIKEYIEEAKERLNIYKKKKTLFDKVVKEMEDEINDLKMEKKEMGLFAFSKKKEISNIIKNKSEEVLEFKKIHEPKELWEDFERMYG